MKPDRFELVRLGGNHRVGLPTVLQVECLTQKFISLYFCFSQVRDIGSGNFGVAKLMKDKQSGQLVAIKFIERGEKVRFNRQTVLVASNALCSKTETSRDPVYLLLLQ